MMKMNNHAIITLLHGMGGGFASLPPAFIP